MEKHILEQYTDTQARVKQLRISIRRLEDEVDKMDRPGYYVTDVVTKGKKGKKSLGSAKVSGFPHNTYDSKRQTLHRRRIQLEEEEQTLLEQLAAVEEYIAAIPNIEIRNIFTLYYVEDLNWVQVAHHMNALYSKKKYSEGSCRLKHDRFLEKKIKKFSKTSVMSVFL